VKKLNYRFLRNFLMFLNYLMNQKILKYLKKQMNHFRLMNLMYLMSQMNLGR